MIELGQLNARYEDFDKRNTQVVAVSLDNLEESGKTKADCSHLVILSDEKQSLARAAELIAPQPSPHGGKTVAPTTVLIDRRGVVRWVSRKDTYLERPTPDEVLAAIDDLKRGGS
jgi:peroxiredoxin